ncbi:hypothetical protein PoB_006440100 [Plakobranchus ocellatus]|uniref:Uncharacterized protein n=1 Tax=Plakobranchus ocellatus TaxID=259542 RepID=A0AAV4D1D2_9GAST|nr:hypothetical protein PoB_006440100 [Plakobranchus ocellatus]
MDYTDVDCEMDSDIHSYACVAVTDNEIDLRSVREQDVFMVDDMIVNYNGNAFELDVDLSANETTKTMKKRETGLWWSATNNSNNRVSRPDLSFFRFPKDEGRCRDWAIKC